MRNMIKIFAMILTVLGVLGTANKASAREMNEVDGPVPWISHVAGQDGALMIKQQDTDWFEATINTPIGEGDMVWQSNEGRSEVFIDKGTYLRLDRESGIEFVELNNRQIRAGVTSGTIEASNGSNQTMLVDVPGQTLILNRGDKVRINVDNDGVTEIMTKQGKVDSDGPNGQVKIKAGQTLVSSPEGKVIRLTGAYKTNDFDNWASRRDKDLSRGSGPPTATASYLPEPALAEMAENGNWINDPEYGWVWQPRVANDWAPYREGRWVERPGWGWTWVSYEPWGWYPHHYGRWVRVHHRWCWRPVAVRAAWSPALVFWVEGPDYVAWQPLPYGVTLSTVVHLSPRVVVSTYVDPLWITVVGYNHFYSGHYHHHHVAWGHHHHHSHYTVVRAPVHVYHRSGHGNVHYRTSRPSGYVHHSRRPNNKVVYAHHRPGRSSSSSQAVRVDYGSRNMPRKNYNQRPVNTASRADLHRDTSTNRRVSGSSRDVNTNRNRTPNNVTTGRKRSNNEVTTGRNHTRNDVNTGRKRSNNEVYTTGGNNPSREMNGKRNADGTREWRSRPMPENYRPDNNRSKNGYDNKVRTANGNRKEYRPDSNNRNKNGNVNRNSNGYSRSKDYRPEKNSSNRNNEVRKTSNNNRNSRNTNNYENKARKTNNNSNRNYYDAPKKEHKEKSNYKKSSSKSSSSSRSSMSKSSSRSSSRSSSPSRSSSRSSSSRSSSRRSPR